MLRHQEVQNVRTEMQFLIFALFLAEGGEEEGKGRGTAKRPV